MKTNRILAPLIVLIIAASAHGQTFLTNGLVAYYPFNGNANDASGNGLNGTLIGNTNFEPGVSGQAITLEGTNYVQVPDAPALNFGPGTDFSITAWIRPQTSSTTFGELDLVDKRYIPPPHPNLTSALGYSLLLLNGQLSCQLSQAPGTGIGNFGPGGPDLRDGKFHFVAMTVVRNSSTGGNLYVDKGVVLTFNPTSEAGDLSNTQPLLIGHNPDPMYNGGFSGGIEEVRIYNRALSSSELYNLAATCSAHAAAATAVVVNGFVVGINITDAGCGYTNPPVVQIVGGGGTGAAAIATVSNGVVAGITVTNAGSGYTNTPTVLIGSPPFPPWLTMAVSKVKVTMHVVLGHNYILESSTDLMTWNPVGTQFTAQSESITQELDVDVTGRYFRITEVP